VPTPADVTALLVVHGRADLTASILAQLDATAPGLAQIRVLDSCSPDAGETDNLLRAWAAAKPRTRRYHRTIHNVGFGAGNRVLWHDTETPFACILNSDLTLSPGWLAMMLAPFADDRVAQVGLASGCTRLAPDGCGGPGPPVEYVEGACMIVRAAAIASFARPGEPPSWALFRPEYPMYCEDADLSLRLRERGWRVRAVDAPVVHTRAQSVGALPPEVRARLDRLREISHQAFLARWGDYLRGERRFPGEGNGSGA